MEKDLCKVIPSYYLYMSIEIVSVEKVSLKQIRDGRKIYIESLGADPKEKLRSRGSFFALEGDQVGVSIASFLKDKDRDYYIQRLLENETAWTSKEKETYEDLKTGLWGTDRGTAVHPDYRDKGIGKDLIERVVKFLKDEGAKGIVVTLWDNPEEKEPVNTSCC